FLCVYIKVCVLCVCVLDLRQGLDVILHPSTPNPCPPLWSSALCPSVLFSPSSFPSYYGATLLITPSFPALPWLTLQHTHTHTHTHFNMYTHTHTHTHTTHTL